MVWIGTNMGSIDKINNYKPHFDQFQIQQKFGSQTTLNNVLALYATDSNSVWLGTGGSGLFRYDFESGKTVRYIVNKKSRNILDANVIRTIIPDDKKNLWIGTLGGGLTHLNINTGQSRQFFYNNKEPGSLSSNNILTLLKDSKERLWIGTEGQGVNLLEKGKPDFQHFEEKPVGHSAWTGNTVYCILEDEAGTIWIGGCNGISKFHENTQSFQSYHPTAFYRKKTLTFCVYDMLYTRMNNKPVIWLGTSIGLIQFNRTNGEFTNFPEATTAEGESIVGIQQDKRGYLWLSTYKGLIKFDPVSKFSRWFDNDDGLQSNMFNISAHTTLPNGDLLFGGINGFNRIKTVSNEKNQYLPQVQITGFDVQGKRKNLSYNDKGNPFIRLTYLENFFRIHFAALDYKRPSNNSFRYRLLDIDDSWRNLRDGHIASYTNIHPGTYRFELVGSNSNGIWNEHPTLLHIFITPPFWQATWFRIIIIVLLIGVVFSLIYYIRFKEKRRTELNQKISELRLQALRSRMNPHFIFNTINAIQYFISENASKEAYFYLSKFSKLLRSTLNSSELSVIPLSKELEILDLYFALQKLRYEDKLEYSITVQPEIESAKTGIPSMLIQPYIENAIVHGIPFTRQSGHISVLLTRHNNALICTIEDNGIGIKQSLKDKNETTNDYPSKGMQLTRERLRIINESISQKIDVKIIDLSDLEPKTHGTKVTIHIPYKTL